MARSTQGTSCAVACVSHVCRSLPSLAPRHQSIHGLVQSQFFTPVVAMPMNEMKLQREPLSGGACRVQLEKREDAPWFTSGITLRFRCVSLSNKRAALGAVVNVQFHYRSSFSFLTLSQFPHLSNNKPDRIPRNHR